MNISLCIITLNEQENLRRCLESAQLLADEIVIVDSGSNDDTESIAKEFSAKWIHRDWHGYVNQKNYAINQATHEWILCLDADEALSPHLFSELLCWKNEQNIPTGVKGFNMPRCVFYEGRWINHGDWYPDRLVRLFKKGAAVYEGGKVHERLVVDGEIIELSGDLEHYSFRDESDHRSRIGKYAMLWAETQYEEGRFAWFGKGWAHGVFRFVRGYLMRGGFLDGRHGLKIAYLTASEVIKKYEMLRKLNQKDRQ